MKLQLSQIAWVFLGVVFIGLAFLSLQVDSFFATEPVSAPTRDQASPSSTVPNEILKTSSARSRLEVGRTCIDLGVANTPQLRSRGLSGEPNIGENEGLLFVYEESGDYGYWMRDMNFPIDIIWLDGEYRVITVASSIGPETYPQSFYPEAPARYVVELAAGRAAELELQEGQVLSVLQPGEEVLACGEE